MPDPKLTANHIYHAPRKKAQQAKKTLVKMAELPQGAALVDTAKKAAKARYAGQFTDAEKRKKIQRKTEDSKVYWAAQSNRASYWSK